MEADWTLIVDENIIVIRPGQLTIGANKDCKKEGSDASGRLEYAWFGPTEITKKFDLGYCQKLKTALTVLPINRQLCPSAFVGHFYNPVVKN